MIDCGLILLQAVVDEVEARNCSCASLPAKLRASVRRCLTDIQQPSLDELKASDLQAVKEPASHTSLANMAKVKQHSEKLRFHLHRSSIHHSYSEVGGRGGERK